VGVDHQFVIINAEKARIAADKAGLYSFQSSKADQIFRQRTYRRKEDATIKAL
jgi:hypothetical protein